uniref:Uncharacterized protein n=1 Tax=Rhizophora mucronata TaxID=61149 RepID=A0A2P2NGK1_RHIMU
MQSPPLTTNLRLQEMHPSSIRGHQDLPGFWL